jgi:hypothetical protein
MRQIEKSSEPPSYLQAPIFMIDRDSKGSWVAQQRGGACRGLFTNRAAALKFAKFDSGVQPHAVVWVSGVLELDGERDAASASRN